MSDKHYDDASTEIVWIGGRYEYEAKGINVFIDSLARVARQNPAKQVAAFIMVLCFVCAFLSKSEVNSTRMDNQVQTEQTAGDNAEE